MNPDDMHLREYNQYLEKLTIQDLLNLTEDEKAIRNNRIESVKNCIQLIEDKKKRDKKE
ncbi:MAG: hypothetical protein KGI05_09425 [Thaumarchaeota archaeon]|nr:hypothetical protein [Nitrososphaerota archaeon]